MTAAFRQRGRATLPTDLAVDGVVRSSWESHTCVGKQVDSRPYQSRGLDQCVCECVRKRKCSVSNKVRRTVHTAVIIRLLLHLLKYIGEEKCQQLSCYFTFHRTLLHDEVGLYMLY